MYFINPDHRYRPFDRTIDLLSDAPTTLITLISSTQHKTMEEYISEVLQQDYIKPSPFFMSGRFFFMQKRGWDQHPFIDYNGLNQITEMHKLSI